MCWKELSPNLAAGDVPNAANPLPNNCRIIEPVEGMFDELSMAVTSGMSTEALLSPVLELLKRPTDAMMSVIKPALDEDRHCKLENDIHAVECKVLSPMLA